MPRVTECATCSKPVYRSSTSAAAPRCRGCRRADLQHGTYAMYKKRGCRCAECRAACASNARTYAAMVKARDGVTPTQKIRPARWKKCLDCGERIQGRSTSTYCGNCGAKRKRQRRPGYWISRARRLAIYDRDGWVCQLCGEPTRPDDSPDSRWYPTLDHIEPWALVLIPDHSDANLRCAHRGCNASRGVGRAA